jgi:hypothetical protein
MPASKSKTDERKKPCFPGTLIIYNMPVIKLWLVLK